MNNLNYHCCVFIRVFQGKKMPPLFFPLLDSFHFCLISFMCCIGCFLAIWISFLEQWDVWGLRGQLKNTALVVHSVTWHWLMRVRTWAEFDRERRGNWRTWGHQKEEGKEMTERRLERCQWCRSMWKQRVAEVTPPRAIHRERSERAGETSGTMRETWQWQWHTSL